MKTFKTLDEAISQIERDYKENSLRKLNDCIAQLKNRSITKYNDVIYIVDEYGILN